MSYLTRKVARRMKRRLGDGEKVLKAAPAARIGGHREFAAGILSGGTQINTIIAAQRAGAAARAALSSEAAGSLVPLPQQCTVALTDRRLLFFSNWSLNNKPRKLVYEVPRDQIEWLGDPAADSVLLTRTQRYVIGVRGPALVAWEVPMLYTRQGRGLFSALVDQMLQNDA